MSRRFNITIVFSDNTKLEVRDVPIGMFFDFKRLKNKIIKHNIASAAEQKRLIDLLLDKNKK